MFLVTEMQDNNEHVGTLSYEFDNRDDAFAKYHNILAAAAKSDVMYHGAAIYENCMLVNYQAFEHLNNEEMLD